MSNTPIRRNSAANGILIGAIAGGVIAGVLRLVVALGYLLYIQEARWWGNTSPEQFGLAGFSAAIDLGVGGVAGMIRQPILAALLGAVLSGAICLVLAVMPATVFIGMCHGTTDDDHKPLYVAWLGMGVAGAMGGGGGALIGRRFDRSTADSRSSFGD